jgi:hypothetical protein
MMAKQPNKVQTPKIQKSPVAEIPEEGNQRIPSTDEAPDTVIVTEGEGIDLSNPPKKPPKETPAETVVPTEFQKITLEIPIDLSAFERGGFIGRRQDVRLTRSQSQSLRTVTDALDRMEMRTADGKPIGRRDGKALIWILEQITAGVFKARGEPA